MLRDFIAMDGAQLIGIGTTLFFFIIFAGVTVRVLTRKAGSYDATAHLPLEGDAPAGGGARAVSPGESQTEGR